jgi:hypothetical protein
MIRKKRKSGCGFIGSCSPAIRYKLPSAVGYGSLFTIIGFRWKGSTFVEKSGKANKDFLKI